jgi:5-formyltetrahydrofolate cyclo-ligase
LVRRQVVVPQPQSPSVVALCERHDLLLHEDVRRSVFVLNANPDASGVRSGKCSVVVVPVVALSVVAPLDV